MNFDSSPTPEREAHQEKFVADLTEAAYRVALRFGLGDQWLTIQLELWRALHQTIHHQIGVHPSFPLRPSLPLLKAVRQERLL